MLAILILLSSRYHNDRMINFDTNRGISVLEVTQVFLFVNVGKKLKINQQKHQIEINYISRNVNIIIIIILSFAWKPELDISK